MKRTRTESLPIEWFTQPELVTQLDVICAICRNVSNDPVVTRCSHVFCKTCMQTAVLYNRTCPTCRTENACNTLSVNSFANRLINKQTVHCPLAMTYQSTACTWTGSLSDAYYHVTNECGLKLTTCLECYKQVRRDSYEHHKNTECIHRITVCSRCVALIPHSELDAHQQHTCGALVTTCAHCYTSMTRSDLLTHVCKKNKSFSCCFARLGCTYTNTKPKVLRHEKTNHAIFAKNAHPPHHLQTLSQHLQSPEEINSLIMDGKHEIIMILLELGLNPNMYIENTPLLVIGTCGEHYDMVFNLLKMNANPNLQTKYNQFSALHFAALKTGDHSIISLLMAFKADPYLENQSGQSPIMLANEETRQFMMDIIKKKERIHGSDECANRCEETTQESAL